MKLEYRDDTVWADEAVYLTYRKWRELMTKQLMDEYDCDRADAELCLGVARWCDRLILPLVRAAVPPSHTIIKSIAKECGKPYVCFLQREFFAATHGEGELIPLGYDLEGMKIQKTFNVSRPRRSRTGGKS